MAKQPAEITALADQFANWHRLAEEATQGKEATRKALLETKRKVFNCTDGTSLHVVQQKRSGWDMDAVKAALSKIRGLDLETLKTCVSFATLRISRPATETRKSA